MNTATIHIKVDSKVKEQAQRVAEGLGSNLSIVINHLLKHFVETKSMHPTKSYRPSEYLKKVLREAEEDARKGYISPPFTNSKDTIAWLRDPNARYENGKSK